ncbi:hypothetical protein Tco_1057450 [Tanacetum coccineum]|uniref:Uncharacterized protein n=1 Tax=Tanacetum coccineum TaxID=301880 RepID=A0ABQ5H7J2_9ASTR
MFLIAAKLKGCLYVQTQRWKELVAPVVVKSSTTIAPSLRPRASERGGGRAFFIFGFGDCDQACEYFHAEFWLPFPRDPPEIIKELFKDRHFMESIRACNMMFSMTSFGANVDDSDNNGSGPYVFKVEG